MQDLKVIDSVYYALKLAKIDNDLTKQPNLEAVKYIKFRGELIELHLDHRCLWVDKFGTVYGIRADESLDSIDRCGVYPFSISNTPLDAGCKVHDYMYSSPAWQYFNTRSESDAYLKRLHEDATKRSGWRLLVQPFYYLARLLGGFAWENEDTRYKLANRVSAEEAYRVTWLITNAINCEVSYAVNEERQEDNGADEGSVRSRKSQRGVLRYGKFGKAD